MDHQVLGLVLASPSIVKDQLFHLDQAPATHKNLGL